MEFKEMVSGITLGELVAFILAVSAAVVAIAKAIEVVAKRIKKVHPCEERMKMLDNDKRHLESIDEILVELKNANKEQIKANGVMFRGISALINHELSGNDVDILRNARDEMQDFLTKKEG